MLKKEDIYVIVDTPKKEKKLLKILRQFNQKTGATPNCQCPGQNSKNKVLGYGFGFDQGIKKECWGVYPKENRFEISIKDLCNVLYIEYFGSEIQLDGFLKSLKKSENNNPISTFTGGMNRDAPTCEIPKSEIQKHEVPNIEFELTPDDYKNNTWYKSKLSGGIIFLEKGKKNYGFFTNPDKFIDRSIWFENFIANGFHIPCNWQESTEQEVLEAFTKEANKRFKVGDKFVSPGRKDWGTITENTKYKFIKGLNIFGFSQDGFTVTNLFHNGVWATVVDPFAELKEAHKNGAVIQYKNNSGEWKDINHPEPAWQREEYRIKPEEKPKVGDFVMAWNNNSDSKAIVGKLEHMNFGAHYSVYKVGGNWYDNAKPITEEQVIKAIFKK